MKHDLRIKILSGIIIVILGAIVLSFFEIAEISRASGRYVVVQKIDRHFSRGETILLTDADGFLSTQTVIAIPGDTAVATAHSVTIDGKTYSYLDDTVPGTFIIAPEQYLFIGHASSTDSGPLTIKGSDIVGSVLFQI